MPKSGRGMLKFSGLRPRALSCTGREQRLWLCAAVVCRTCALIFLSLLVPAAAAERGFSESRALTNTCNRVAVM